MAHTIAAMRDVIASGKAVRQEPLSRKEKNRLRKAMLTAEMVLRDYISSSSQKTLLAPEFSTIKILEEIGKDKMQQLASVGIKSSEPTRQDWKLVSNQQEAFEDQLMSIFDMCRALTQIQGCTVSPTFALLKPPAYINALRVYILFPANDTKAPNEKMIRFGLTLPPTVSHSLQSFRGSVY
ncbi:MAG: hypothetical protein L6R42_011491 [Xanthoria sp. 1 TBL-2021]|nr:MAG: hypothetical protein L6R42_011491 [Xanthoria sp. 1 TBL-2021]